MGYSVRERVLGHSHLVNSANSFFSQFAGGTAPTSNSLPKAWLRRGDMFTQYKSIANMSQSWGYGEIFLSSLVHRHRSMSLLCINSYMWQAGTTPLSSDSTGTIHLYMDHSYFLPNGMISTLTLGLARQGTLDERLWARDLFASEEPNFDPLGLKKETGKIKAFSVFVASIVLSIYLRNLYASMGCWFELLLTTGCTNTMSVEALKVSMGR